MRSWLHRLSSATFIAAATSATEAVGAIVVAPAMNVRMWEHPAVRRNLSTLKRDGVEITGSGPFTAYASVIDNTTNDPVLVPVVSARAAAKSFVVPSVAHQRGVVA